MLQRLRRMRLSPVVTDEDLNLAIKTMLGSFISAQKFGVQRALRRQFTRYLDADVDMNQLLLNSLRAIVRERQALEFVRTGRASRAAAAEAPAVDIPAIELEERASRHNISRQQIEAFFASQAFRNAGFVWDRDRRIIALGER